MERELLFLKPVCTHNIWGGTRLRTDYGYEVEGDDIGECWGISAHPNGDGEIRNGRLVGRKLSEVWEEYPELFGRLKYDRFPLLTKIIDARDDLSIQVHPDDTYAAEHENGSFGKTECWYVLDCPKDATLVIGHHAKDRGELEAMINEGRWNEFIREIPVAKGDFVQIDPGTVHAIKGGMLILETQQNSDITYRVYDYDRLSNGKPRELHIRQSIDVITVPAASPEQSVKKTGDFEPNRLQSLYSCEYYEVFKLVVQGKAQVEQSYPFLNLSVVEGSGQIDGHNLKKGDHLIVPNRYGRIVLEGTMEIIASTVPVKE